MTECERIIAEGVLPESFFEEEVRCGFLVTKERKKIWAVELDLLLKFDEVCNKFGLTYFLFFGSLLGAVRHNGFIPWDDDLDIAMPRRDYNELLQLKAEFNSPYFLQTPYTDESYFYSYAKIRNSNTTSLSQGFRYQGYNHGIPLDVFCIDDWEKDVGEGLFNSIKQMILDNSAYMCMSNPMAAIHSKKWSGNDPLETYKRIQTLAMSFYNQKTEYVCLPNITIYGYAKDVFYKDDFASAVLLPFEAGYRFPSPCGYHRVLSTIYGNYHEYPPKDERGTHHTATIDPDTPYPQKKFELDIR